MAAPFKAYDIRGIVGEELTEKRTHLIGHALAAEVFTESGPVVVSRDMRTHSPALATALATCLSEGGHNVIDIGLAATPMNYWANVEYSAIGSMQVTASHNGPKYNGFKISGPHAMPIDYATGLDRVEPHYYAQGAIIDHLDGLTVEMSDWWFNLRSSNTEPLLRLNLEASTDEARAARFAEVRTLIEASGKQAMLSPHSPAIRARCYTLFERADIALLASVPTSIISFNILN